MRDPEWVSHRAGSPLANRATLPEIGSTKPEINPDLVLTYFYDQLSGLV